DAGRPEIDSVPRVSRPESSSTELVHGRGCGARRIHHPKKNAAAVPRRSLFKQPDRLLRYGLLERAIDLLVGRVAAGLAGLSGLQRLVGSALRAVSGGPRRSGSAGCGVRGGL